MSSTNGARGKRAVRNRWLIIAMVCLVAFAAAGCSASTGKARQAPSTSSTLAHSTSSPQVAPQRELERKQQRRLLEQHLAAYLTDSGGNSRQTASCIAQETVRLEGGVAGMAKLGIDDTMTTSQLSDAFNQLLEDRMLTAKTEPFDRMVDAMFSCGIDKQYRSEFETQLRKDGNTPAASACLADRVLGDRYLRLVLMVGTQSGTAEDPRVKAKFADPLIAAVDRAAHVCGVVSWGGS